MSTTRLGLLLPYRNCSMVDAVRLACVAEDAGFAGVWAAEAACSDALALLAAVATRTKRVELGTAVVPLGSRSPALLAMAAQTVNDLSAGRLTLGVGVSSRTIMEGWHGVQAAGPVATVRDALAIVDQVFRGQRTSYDGATYSSAGFSMTYQPDSRPPVLLAALGPVMRRLATEVAEGTILNFLPRGAVDQVKNGAATRTLALVRVGIGGEEVVEVLRHSVRRELASYLRVPPYARWFASTGFDADVARVHEAETSEQRTQAVSATLVEETAILGQPEYCREKLADLAEAGVEPLVVPVTAEPGTHGVEQLLRALG